MLRTEAALLVRTDATLHTRAYIAATAEPNEARFAFAAASPLHQHHENQGGLEPDWNGSQSHYNRARFRDCVENVLRSRKESLRGNAFTLTKPNVPSAHQGYYGEVAAVSRRGTDHSGLPGLLVNIQTAGRPADLRFGCYFPANPSKLKDT